MSKIPRNPYISRREHRKLKVIVWGLALLSFFTGVLLVSAIKLNVFKKADTAYFDDSIYKVVDTATVEIKDLTNKRVSPFLLGQNINPYSPFEYSLFKKRVSVLDPTLLRYSDWAFFWDNDPNIKNDWAPGWKQYGTLRVENDHLVMKTGTAINYKFDPNLLQDGKKYTLKIRYSTGRRYDNKEYIDPEDGQVHGYVKNLAMNLMVVTQDQPIEWINAHGLMWRRLPPTETVDNVKDVTYSFTYKKPQDRKVGRGWAYFSFSSKEEGTTMTAYIYSITLTSEDGTQIFNYDVNTERYYLNEEFLGDSPKFILTPQRFDKFLRFLNNSNAGLVFQINPQVFAMDKIPHYEGNNLAGSKELLDKYIDENIIPALARAKANSSKQIYLEIGSEIELWWGNGSTQVDINKQKYKRYGILFSRIADRVHARFPDIKTIAYIATFAENQLWKVGIKSFDEGRQEYQRIYGRSAPMPDLWNAHTYLAAAWGEGKCKDVKDYRIYSPDEMKSCVDWVVQGAMTPKVYCDLESLTIKWPNNINAMAAYQTYDFQNALYTCSREYIKQKFNVSTVRFIPTEWGASGSTAMVWGTFGHEILAAELLGRYANLGVWGATHFSMNGGHGIVSGFGRINAPYATFLLYKRLLFPNTDYLQEGQTAYNPEPFVYNVTSNSRYLTAYAYKKTLKVKNDYNPRLILMLVNHKISSNPNDATEVSLRLENGYNLEEVKAYYITCSDNKCLYELQKSKINDLPVTSDTINQLSDELPYRRLLLTDKKIRVPYGSVVFLVFDKAKDVTTVTPTMTHAPTDPPSPTPSTEPTNTITLTPPIVTDTVQNGVVLKKASDLKANCEDGRIKLTFKDNSQGECGYRIARAVYQDNKKDWVYKYATILANNYQDNGTVIWNDTNVDSNKEYIYNVQPMKEINGQCSVYNEAPWGTNETLPLKCSSVSTTPTVSVTTTNTPTPTEISLPTITNTVMPTGVSPTNVSPTPQPADAKIQGFTFMFTGEWNADYLHNIVCRPGETVIINLGHTYTQRLSDDISAPNDNFERLATGIYKTTCPNQMQTSNFSGFTVTLSPDSNLECVSFYVIADEAKNRGIPRVFLETFNNSSVNSNLVFKSTADNNGRVSMCVPSNLLNEKFDKLAVAVPDYTFKILENISIAELDKKTFILKCGNMELDNTFNSIEAPDYAVFIELFKRNNIRTDCDRSGSVWVRDYLILLQNLGYNNGV